MILKIWEFLNLYDKHVTMYTCNNHKQCVNVLSLHFTVHHGYRYTSISCIIERSSLYYTKLKYRYPPGAWFNIWHWKCAARDQSKTFVVAMSLSLQRKSVFFENLHPRALFRSLRSFFTNVFLSLMASQYSSRDVCDLRPIQV